jgi:nucleotide-binding universal stress UspA family protein
MTTRRDSTLLRPDDTVLLDEHDRPRIVAALMALPADEPVLAEAVDSARRLAGELVLLHAVPLSFAERSVGLDQALLDGARLLATATALATARGQVPKEARLVRMRPHELVGELLETDLLVIGGPRSGPPGRLGLIAGSTTRFAPCTVLVVPR